MFDRIYIYIYITLPKIYQYTLSIEVKYRKTQTYYTSEYMNKQINQSPLENLPYIHKKNKQ